MTAISHVCNWSGLLARAGPSAAEEAWLPSCWLIECQRRSVMSSSQCRLPCPRTQACSLLITGNGAHGGAMVERAKPRLGFVRQCFELYV